MKGLRSCETFQYKQTKIDHNKPDLIFLEKKEKIFYMVDAACPFDPQTEKKEKDKLKNYTDLKMWKNEVTKVYIVLVVIGTLGMVSKSISKFLEVIVSTAPSLDKGDTATNPFINFNQLFCLYS